jgi:hypothetical protein
MANTATASSVPIGDGDSAEDIARKFVHLAFRVPVEVIRVQKIEEEVKRESEYNAFVSFQDGPSYVFKIKTTPTEIKLGKKLSQLTDVPEGLSFVGVSHFGSQKDLEEGKVFEIASTPSQEIANLDSGTQYYSLQPFVDATKGGEIVKKWRRSEIVILCQNINLW